MKNKKRLLFVSALFCTMILTGCGKKTKPISGDSTNNLSDVISNNDSMISTAPINNSKYTLNVGTGNFETMYQSSVEPKENIQDGTILHAWNWSMTNIKNNMKDIAEAGYTAVQTSPMQPQKDYYPGDTVSSAWWKMYQPLGFSIATKNNTLGTKSDLKEMCDEAEKYGIKVIVDVVANHLAGGSETSLNSTVREYEPIIYDNNLIYTTKQYANDDDTRSIVQGQIGGYPNLITSDQRVQDRVASLLKEYIDVGVDGFRFDAAKHIETPSDGDYGSDFWTDVLGQSTSYAASKGKQKPFYYGEILNSAGNYRSYGFYTSFMSVTDNNVGTAVRNAFNSTNAGGAIGSTFTNGVTPSTAVLWAESHDTYANKACESGKVSQYNINKAYALVASRAKSASLYLARTTNNPIVNNLEDDKTADKLGAVGTYHWKDKPIAEVNKFHNYFGNSSEYLASDNNFAMNVRYTDNDCGMVLINAGTSTSVNNVAVPTVMKNGIYVDQVSGNTFTISNGKVSGTMDSSCIAVLYNPITNDDSTAIIKPSIDSTKFNDDIEITFDIYNATEATVKVNGSSPVNTKSGIKINTKNMEDGESLVVEISAKGKNGVVTKTFTYTKSTFDPTKYTIQFKATDIASESSEIYAYCWNSSSKSSISTWPGTAMTYSSTDGEGNKYYSYTFDSTKYDYIIFNGGNGSWQTVDIKLPPNLPVGFYLDGSTTVNSGGTKVYNATAF